MTENGFPRRNRMDLWTPAEKAIYDAVQAVEAAGCDPLLTDAVNLLQEARDKVADFVEGKKKRYDQPVVPLRDHLIGLSNGGHCVECGEASHRIMSHPHMDCKKR